MTIKIAVDENNDWFLNDRKNLATSTELQAVLEMCQHAAKVVIGELVFDVEKGVLSFEVGGVFGNLPDLLFFDSRARDAWLEIDGVEEVVRLDASIENNTLSYQANIRTIYGTEDISDAL